MNNKYVLIRGLARGNGHWGNFLKVLASFDPKAEIEIYEIPGSGTRFKESTPIDPAEIINDFRRHCQFVKNKTPFILCGISLGGMLALKWLEVFPDDVLKTYVINSSLHSLSPFYQRLRFNNYLSILEILMTLSPEEMEIKILQLTSNNQDLSPQIVEKLVSFSKNHPVARLNVLRQIYLASKINVSRQLKQPIQVIQSSQDHLVNPVCSQRIADYLGAALIVHSTAGHDIPLDDPEWLAKTLMG